VGAGTRNNKPSGLVGLVLRPALAFSLVVFEEALVAEVEGSEKASAAIEVEALAIGEASVATEEVAMVIEEVSEAEAALAIRVVVDSEAVVDMRMVLLRPMRPVDQVVPVVATVVNQTAALHRSTAIAAAMATLIERDTVEPVRLEGHDKTAVTNEEASPEAIENQSWLVTEAMVEIEIVTATVTGNGKEEATGTGMAALADDGTMILARGKDTMKVMAMMTREANEGIKSSSLHQTVRPQQQQHSRSIDNNVTNGFFGGYLRCSSPLLACLFQHNTTQRFVGGYLHVRLRLHLTFNYRLHLRLPLRLLLSLESISSLLPAPSEGKKKGIGSRGRSRSRSRSKNASQSNLGSCSSRLSVYGFSPRRRRRKGRKASDLQGTSPSPAAFETRLPPSPPSSFIFFSIPANNALLERAFVRYRDHHFHRGIYTNLTLPTYVLPLSLHRWNGPLLCLRDC